jgi:hypothetical protein
MASGAIRVTFVVLLSALGVAIVALQVVILLKVNKKDDNNG